MMLGGRSSGGSSNQSALTLRLHGGPRGVPWCVWQPNWIGGGKHQKAQVRSTAAEVAPGLFSPAARGLHLLILQQASITE